MKQCFRLKQWIAEHLDKDKQSYSKDAVEILLTLLWKEAQEAERAEQRAQAEADKYGDVL